jgi:hypothetical protein
MAGRHARVIYRELDQAIGAVQVPVECPARSVLCGILNITSLAVLGYHTTPVARSSSLPDRLCYQRSLWDHLSLAASPVHISTGHRVTAGAPRLSRCLSLLSSSLLRGTFPRQGLPTQSVLGLASHSCCARTPRPPTALGQAQTYPITQPVVGR